MDTTWYLDVDETRTHTHTATNVGLGDRFLQYLMGLTYALRIEGNGIDCMDRGDLAFFKLCSDK